VIVDEVGNDLVARSICLGDEKSRSQLKIRRLGNPSVSDTLSLVEIVRKVEFKLLQIISFTLPSAEPAAEKVFSGRQSDPSGSRR